jgi:hypothetical protein
MSCAFPTARGSFLASQQARKCQKHGLCGVLAPLIMAVVAVHRHRLLTSQLCIPPLGLSESFTVPILVLQDSFSLPTTGLEEEVLHIQWLHIPSETRSGCGQDGPLFEQILLEWPGRGVIEVVRAQDGPCTNPHCRSGYGWGSVLHVFSGHNRRHKSVSRAQKRAAKILTHVESKTRFQRQGPADLQPFRHDEEYLRCRIRCRIRHRMRYNIRHRMRYRLRHRTIKNLAVSP